jgi:acetyl-CoA acetyltransferase
MSDATRIALVGAAECDLGATGLSVLELQTQAVTRALADAGLSLWDVDGLATNGVSRFSTTQLAEYLGLQPRWVESTFVGGSAYETYVARAAQAIRDGAADVVVVSYASNQRSAKSRSLAGVQDEHMPDARLEAPYHPLFPISFYAMAAQRHMHDYGTTPEQLAEVAVAAREWACANPVAFRHDDGPLTLDKVLGSPVVSSPLHTLDCCLVTDGGGAVVVTSLERARDLAKAPVELLGYGEATTHNAMSQAWDLSVTGAVPAGVAAFARSGLTPADVDVVQVYDSFTITVLLTLEALGFCGYGESGAFVSNGRIGPGGDFPLNTTGGGLSYCHPGQFGVLLLVEAVRQLRGECGQRQVPDAQVALCHGTGGILSHHATVILGADR